MSDISIDELKAKVQEREERRKKSYGLARSLGFSGVESSLLQGKDEETIRRLAAERKAATGD